jgi:hypothetical protein
MIAGPSVVNAHVYENSMIGAGVVDFHATGGTVTWSLNSTTYFGISSQGAVAVAANLDREAIPAPHSISVLVTATGGGQSDTVTLVVSILDVNDNAPMFLNPSANGSHDFVNVIETEPVGTIVYTILASDPDYGSGGDFNFVLTNPDGYFLVGYLTGDVQIHKSLDYETNTRHILNVAMQDLGVPSLTSTATIIVDVVNDEDVSCSFSQNLYYSSISEGTYTGMSLPTIATVLATPINPSNSIKYSITINPYNLFSIGQNTGVVKVGGTLDRENISRYIVSVSGQEHLSNGDAVDSPLCNATIVLTVTDINDNVPTFHSSLYSGTINENVPLGHVAMATIDAFDLDVGSNAVFNYRIRDPPGSSKFQINSFTGVINVTGTLDYESSDINYEFTIEAYEPATLATPGTGTATVTIHVLDVNDNTPYFQYSSYSFSLYEEQSPLSLTPLILAYDNDVSSSFNTLTFTLTGLGAVSPFERFQITSPSTNQAQLSTLVSLDRENISSYHLVAVASDNGPISLTNTTDIFITVLDINDNAPLFDLPAYSLDIVEETSYASCLTVHAADLMDEPGPNTLVSYSITVDSASPNTSIGGIQNRFTIDSGTGVVTCLPINHEYGYHNIVLRVTASDSGTNPGPLSTDVLVNVAVEDVNEHPPIFNQATYTASVYENSAIGTTIGLTVVAIETGDTGQTNGITYTIISGNTNGAFAVGEVTGVFSVHQPLDYETIFPNPLNIKVRASDGVHSTTATVLITIIDVNDNTPYILHPLGHPTITVSEADGPRIITTIIAVDPDGDSDGVVTYSFVHPAHGTFSMDSATGTLLMSTPPDRDILPSDTLNITLIAKDQPTDPATARINSTYIFLHVTDANDNAPVFTTPAQNVQVPEDTAGAVTIFTVQAADNADIGSNAEIEYFLGTVSPAVVHPGGLAKFQVGQSTGEVQTGPAGFDYEDPTDRSYIITILAQDKGVPAMTATTTSTVTITDVNDNPPDFTEPNYSASVNENNGLSLTAADVSLINNIDVTDVDSTTFTYSIVDPLKTNGLFSINANTGEIYIPSGTNVDREDSANVIDSFGRAVFTFQIRVSDGLLSDVADVTIYVTDVNDKSPMFAQHAIVTGVPENAAAGTVVDVITAVDDDYGTNAAITYTKTSGDTGNLFSIPDPSVGKITVSGSVDREAAPAGVVFNMTAADSAGNSDSIQVTVMITDMNDNSPIFSPSFYQVTVSEDAAVDHLAQTVNATDGDTGTNGDITYAIAGGNTGNAFYIKNPSVGDIRVFTALDRETLSFYRLIVTATDGALGNFKRTGVAEVAITIGDVNDNSPSFLHTTHRGNVAENSPSNTFISVAPSIYATDSDIGTNGAVTYDIQTGSPFRIDSTTGFMYTSGIGIIDREAISLYTLEVYARDGGGLVSTATAVITVTDVNDNAPIIAQTPAALDTAISETMAKGMVVATITATDADVGVNAVLIYSLTGGEGYFQVDGTGNVILAQSLLSIERRLPFVLTVKVNDGGLPSLSDTVTFRVNVTDANDNRPILNHPPAVFVRPEGTTNFILTLSPGLWTSGVVTDADDGLNGQFDFYLDSSSSSVFSFDNSTGILSLGAPLDYESKTFHSGLIYIADRGTPSLLSATNLTISLTVTDVNDQPPIFAIHNYQANVSELTASNIPVLLVSATDNDTSPNNIIRFRIVQSVPGAGTDLFKIDANSGLILTKTTLEESTKGCYNLTVEAYNPDQPTLNDLAIVYACIVDINQSPSFIQSLYDFDVLENEPRNTYVGTVTANDPDSDASNSNIRYLLLSSTGLFHINVTTGVLRTLVPLDSDAQSLYILSVVVQDMGQGNLQHTNYTTVIVNVLDLNDNSPQFISDSYESPHVITEGIAINTLIFDLEARDIDQYPINKIFNFRITSDPRDLFEINATTGELKTKKGGLDDFDRETTPTYTITIEVYNFKNASNNDGIIDASRTEQLNITFILGDVNDNAPYFTHAVSRVCLDEDNPLGTIVTVFSGADDDEGINARVFYQITKGNIGETFSIDALNGSLRVFNHLDYETLPHEYNLTIRIQDLGDSLYYTATVTTNVTVCVNNTNDNGPQFASFPPPLYVLENATDNTPVVTVPVVDADGPPFDESAFIIVSGNELGAFYFNNVTFDNNLYVRDASLIDYESDNKTFVLFLIAYDVGNPLLNDSSAVTISIVDVNDNSPVMIPADLHVAVREDVSVGSILEQVTAVDADSGLNALLSYSIYDGDHNGTFMIDVSDGLLRLAKPLDYDDGLIHYNLTVLITDGGNPTLSGTGVIHVEVIDVNDNSPVFIMPPLANLSSPQSVVTQVNISEAVVNGTWLYTAVASDSDSGAGGVVIYSFSGGINTFASVFYINATTGVITTIGILDRETISHYIVTVVARDNGNPPRQGTARFNITIIDFNDHRPAFATPFNSLHYVYENRPIGQDQNFTYFNGTDLDSSDVIAGRFYYYNVIDGRLSSSECDGAVCVTLDGRVYNRRIIDREVDDYYIMTIAISNNPALSALQAVEDLHLETATIHIQVLDLNDNSPVFTGLETKLAVSVMDSVGKRIHIIRATDADASYYGLVWYSMVPNGAALSIETDTGIITTSASFQGEANAKYILEITAYDNRGNAPSLSTTREYELYVYNDEQVTIQVNTSDFIYNGIQNYTFQLQQTLGGSVIITDVRVGINPRTGEIDPSKTQIIFINIDEGDRPADPGDVERKLRNSTAFINPQIIKQTVLVPITEGYPVWALVLIIVGLCSFIMIICSAFCAFLIVEKRRNRQLLAKTSELTDEFSLTKASSEYNTTNNPLFIIENETSSISSVKEDNPIYEAQEVNLEIFDDETDSAHMSSTENLISPPSNASTLRRGTGGGGGARFTDEDLLDQAMGLPTDGNEEWDNDEYFSMI